MGMLVRVEGRCERCERVECDGVRVMDCVSQLLLWLACFRYTVYLHVVDSLHKPDRIS